MDSLIKRLFEKIKYYRCSKNSFFDGLSIEYKQRLFTKQPIDCLTDNKVVKLRVSFIKLYLDNRR